jgi:benzoylformate decarboxylase
MTMKTVAQVLMEILQNEGVEYVFGLPGATEVHFLDAIEKQEKIKYILCLQEPVVIGAAEGYARTSGKVGVLNIHTNTGLASIMGLLVNARNGGIPLLITAGQNDSRLQMQEPHLTGPLANMADMYTKWSTEVHYAEEIPIAIQRGFKMALQPPTGPVFVSLPQNILEQSLDYEYKPDTPVMTKLRPDKDALYQAMDLLVNARKPVILVEEGVARNKALHEVVKLAELIGAPVYNIWMSEVNFPTKHPQYLGELSPPSPQTRETLKGVDTLLVIGCKLFSYHGYDPVPLLDNNTRIIQIDDNPWEIAKNFPVTVGIQSHIREAVAELTSLLGKKMSPEDMKAAQKRKEETAKKKETQMAALMRQAKAESDNVPIAVSRFALELNKALPAGALIVDDSWSSSNLIRQYMDFREVGDFQRARQGGAIGWGMPGAIGVQLAAPDRPVVSVCGDGSAVWSIQSLWTAAHYNLPITYVILANQSYHIAKLRWIQFFGGKPSDRHHSLELDNPVLDFCQIAQGMGVHSQKVDKPEELGKTLKSALESGKTELIEVSIKAYP